MAGQTTTSVVQVTVTDSGGYSKSFNLEYPKQNLTLNQIKAAFQPAIDGGWWLGSKGDPIVAVSKATYSTSTKIEIAGGEITFTPSTLNMDAPTTQYSTTTGNVTVEGGAIQTVSIEKNAGEQHFDKYDLMASFSGNVVTVTCRLLVGVTPNGIRATLTIVIDSKLYTVPVVVGSPS